MSKRSYVPHATPDVCDVFHLDPSRLAELRGALIGEDAVTDLAETFRALGDPTRVRLLDALSHGELCVCDLATLIGLSESAVSHQLRLLRNLRLVKPRRAGRMVFYALDDRHIMTLFRQGLRHVQEPSGRERSAPVRASTGRGR
jgi:DNA-binding transcriptional ArsR family regulator